MPHDDAARREISDRMRAAGVPEAAISSFLSHFDTLLGGGDGLLSENDIEPVAGLADAEGLVARRAAGVDAFSRTAVIKLNGGLGTSMGLDRAKSLLEVRDGHSFLDLIARQILSLRRRAGGSTPLLLMNSFRTAADSEQTLARYPDLAVPGLPSGFVQNKVPRLFADSLRPASSASDPDLEWCPPGHGDLYTAIAGTGVLGELLDRGIEYAFVSNADNLGAVLDPALLGHMVEHGFDFMLEAADRTAADRKGGHLCRLADGRLALRESAQCPDEDSEAFQDVEFYRYFNTNNLWLRLPALAELLKKRGGYLPLPTIVNRKTLDPRDPSTTQVIQLETAMGAAISLFDNATAVRVPRRRFSPVKNTNDLLGVRSDAYRLTDEWRIVLHPDRNAPPVIDLDDRFYKVIDDFEARFPCGPPSLLHCDRLTVKGDVTFGADITARGVGEVVAFGKASVPDGAKIEGRTDLDPHSS